jgi:ATP-dependent DNA helicase DinG
VTAGADLPARVDRVFAPRGPLASAFEGFEPRPGQRELAGAVAQAIETGGALVAEAGTGTGKTLAYLVPAVLAGQRVLISTGTRTLQDQIFYKDIPALAAAIGISVRAAYIKGRTNYLCMHRFDRLHDAAASLEAEERAWLERITAWAAETETGDRAEIADLPDDFPLWSDLTASSEQCLGRECPRVADCFITRMRDRAAEAQIVIVNHHLLCADASVRQSAFGEVIPECDVAIIDEAHQLEDVVTQYFGVALSAHRVDEFARDATGAVASIAADRGRFAADIAEAASDAQQAARRLFDVVRLEVGSRESGGDRVTLTETAAARLRDPGSRLATALDRLAGLVARAMGPPEDVVALAARAAAMRDDLDTLLAAADPRFVHFIERRGRGLALRAAPIDVAEIVRDSVLGGRRATVLTSATLTVEGTFTYIAGRLGLGDAATLRLPSEFDFTRQAVLFLPSGLPDPRASEFNRAAAWTIAEILDLTEGRTFALFTSYAAMREVHALLERRVSWPLLVQGTAPRTALLRDFRATPHAVLLATSSFWQGVDVVGEALSCVIIDRLPFVSPADPLIAARLSAITARGGRPFDEYQVPLATLTLLQGLGRLIRAKSDRGVLAVLDPRLTQKGYGRRFLASMPPAPITDDLASVARFLRGDDGDLEAGSRPREV